MTALTTRLTAGSIHSHPVQRISSPAPTVPSETRASAAMCRKAPWTLRSDLRPLMNSSAVAPLITNPTAATIVTVSPATGSVRHQPLDRLPRDAARDEQQRHGIAECRQDRAAAQAVCVGPAGPALAERGGDPGGHEPQHVAQIVPGIGQQGERVGGDAINGLGGDIDDVERDPDSERPAEGLGRVVVPVMAVPMPMPVMVVVVRHQVSAAAIRAARRAATSVLARRGQSSTPSAVTRWTSLSSPPMMPVAGLTSLATIQSQSLRAAWRRRSAIRRRRSRRRSRSPGAAAAGPAADKRGQDVGVRHQLQRRRRAARRPS